MKQAVWKRVAALSYTATLVVGSQIAYGGAWATLNYREINAASGVCWRSWAVMSQTNKVQGICDLGNDGIEPPTTNGPSHIGNGDELSVNPATPPAVGYNGLIWSAMNQARGRVMGNIETSTTQQRQGLYRVFSDYTITGAAYYLDGPQTYMDAGAPPTSNCFGAWRVDVVNPAYVIPFDMAPVAAPAYVVTGSVYASEGGGNNQLERGWILVEWRYGNETLWREGVNTLSGDGSFGFVPALVSNAAIYVRARVKDANTPRPWFPQSAQYLLNVAYSAPPLIDITNTPMIAAPGTTSVTLGGTNVNVTSPMWWSNSVAAGGGEVNFVGNHFYVVVTNLVTGVNGIYVYGTNVFGHWTNDSVLVTVAGPNAPVVGWVVSNVLGSIGQLRDGSGTISNAFRIEDGDADVCEVFGVEYSLNKINWQVIPWAQLSGATVGLASASVLISAPAHVVRWGAREALGQSVASGWLRMRVRDAGMLVSEWAEGAFVYDGVCQNFAITAPNGGMNFATNRGAGATWTVSGTIEVGASRVRVYNLLTGGMGEDTTVGPLWDAQVSMGNGTNVLVAVGTDYYGNEARVTQTVVIADARWPFVDIIEPAGSVTNVAAERSYYEIQSTNANVTVLRVIVNGQATSYEAARTPYNFTVALGEGTNVITVEGTNELGSAEDTVRIIRPTLIVSPGAPYVEIVDPEVVVTTVPAGQTVYHVRSTNANMVAIGTILDGVMRLYTPAVSPYNFSVALREGINTVTVIGTNAAGVVAEDSVTIIRPAQPRTPGAPYVDIIDPATVVTHVPWGQVTYNVRSTNANVVALAVQINDGPAHYVALANPYNFTIALAEGITTITLSGTNAVGVRAADSVTIVRAPIVPPVPGTPYVDIIDPAEAVRYVSGTQTTYLIRSTNAHVVSIGTILNSVMQLQPAVSPYDFEIALAEGLNTITVAGTNAGGVMALDSVTIVRPRVDVQAGEPYVEITDPGAVITHVPMKQTGYLVRSTNAHVTAVGFLTNGVLQMGAAVNPYEVQMVLGVGVNTITIVGTNAAGRAAWDSATIVRGGGGMPPAIVSIVPPSGYVSVTSVVGMTITVSDDLGQVVVQVNGQVAGGTYPVYSYQFGLGAEGQWVTAMVVVTDNEGMAATQSVWYTWSRVGNVAPIVHILQPSTDGSVMPTNYIPVFGTAEDIDGTVVRVEVDGEVVNGSYYPWYVPGYGPLQVGTNVIRALAIDNGGATGKAERVVYYEGLAPKDVVPPVVRIVQPENWFEATHSPIVVSGWATDNYAVAAVEVNGTVVAPPGYPGAWEHTLGLQPGTNMIVARATDHAGNAGYATAMVVYVAGVDTNPPSVWITSHYNHEVVYEADQVIAGTSSDGMRGSGVTSVYVNAERAIGVAPFVRPMRLNYGMNVVTAIAIDGAGNTSAPASVIIYYLTNPPMPVAGITISTPSVPETNVAQVVFGGWYGINDLPLSGVITARVNGQVVWSMVTASGPVIAPWNAGLIELAPGTNMLGAELTLQSGFVVTAQRMIVYTFDTNVPSIAIVTPQDGSTVGVRRVGLRGTYALNGGALGRISASVNGEEVGVQVDVPGAGQWDGGEVLLRRGWNEIRARIELSNSNSAEHVIQVYCSSEVPEVVITHPQAATSRYAQVLYFGTFDFRAATNGMVIGWLNGTPVMVYTPAAGITQGTWSAGEVTLQLGLNILSARVVVATGEADDDVVRIVYDPNYEDTSRPRIQIVEPSAVVTNATPVRFYGTYDLGGGILDYLTGYVNNVGCALEINARTTWDGGTKGLVLGMNQFVAIVRLKNGAAATSRWDIVLTYDDPFIQITFPTLEETWVTEANQIHLGGVYLCVTTRLAAITWRNEANGAEGLAVWTNGYWNAHYVPLQACTNNRVVVTLRNAGGYEVRDVITILVPSSNETLEVICNWPRYLGVGQTGLVEFLSVEAEVPYRIYWGPTNNNVVIGSGTVRAGEMIGARYYQVGRYRIDDASLVLNGRGVSNDIWLAVVGATTRVARLPRTTYVVPNMVVNQKAVVNQDIDGDVFTVTYKGEESTVRQVIGRTVVLSNLTGQESLAVKVKQNANGGDGAVVLAMLEIESGVLKGLKWVGDVDDVVVSGSLERIAISGGNLGYCYDGRSRYYHGLVATRNGSSEGRGLKQVTVKAKKVKVNGQSVVVGGNIEGDVRADMSMQGKGVTIAAGNGSVQARIVVDAIKGLVAKGRAPAGMISNSHVIARGEIVGKGISIGKVQTRVLHDTMVVGAGDIKGVAAEEVTDSTRDLQGDVTNHPRRAMQIIAGWRHGGLDAPFRPWLVASNGYGGVIVSGVVHRVSAKSVCEGVGVTEFGEKGIKKPSEKVNQTNFAWWVNGQLAPADWDGKSRP